jgi:hypothetical protein
MADERHFPTRHISTVIPSQSPDSSLSSALPIKQCCFHSQIIILFLFTAPHFLPPSPTFIATFTCTCKESKSHNTRAASNSCHKSISIYPSCSQSYQNGRSVLFPPKANYLYTHSLSSQLLTIYYVLELQI